MADPVKYKHVRKFVTGKLSYLRSEERRKVWSNPSLVKTPLNNLQVLGGNPYYEWPKFTDDEMASRIIHTLRLPREYKPTYLKNLGLLVSGVYVVNTCIIFLNNRDCMFANILLKPVKRKDFIPTSGSG